MIVIPEIISPLPRHVVAFVILRVTPKEAWLDGPVLGVNGRWLAAQVELRKYTRVVGKIAAREA
jgi:hypothetical protein